jgi:CBS domain-containing protein
MVLESGKEATVKVKDVMHRGVTVCTPEMNLAEAAAELWRNCCGCLPVIGEGGNVIGIITDRDICISLGTRDDKASKVTVWEAINRKLFTCSPEDDIHCALKTIRAHKVHRLPVVDRGGVVVGLLSVDDVVQNAQRYVGKEGISFEDVVTTLQAISARDSMEPAQHS